MSINYTNKMNCIIVILLTKFTLRRTAPGWEFGDTRLGPCQAMGGEKAYQGPGPCAKVGRHTEDKEGALRDMCPCLAELDLGRPGALLGADLS